MSCALSLLGDALIRAHTEAEPEAKLSLPQLLARLSAGEALQFPTLRPHQQAAWHAFLVQLAFLALELAGTAEPPTDDATWCFLLRALTPQHPADEPWHLVVDDWQQPAFLQSPCLRGAQADYKKVLHSAQEIDRLITSKNHDEKVGKLALPGVADADVVVFALVSLQGFTAGLGSGKFNSMRMNGYYSSRPQFRLAFQRGTGAEFCRDVGVLLAQQDALREEALSREIGTALQHRLLWLPVWGAEPLSLASVHPLCLEVCRRIRLGLDGNTLRAATARSATARVDAEPRNGAVMDPWTPLVKDPKDGSTKALTAQAHSFGYRYLSTILFDGQQIELPLLARPAATERGSGSLVAQVLVGGSGRSDGLLRREIAMPGKAMGLFANARATLAQRSHRFIEVAGTLQGKVLRPALLQFIDGSDDPDWANGDFDKYCKPWMARFDQRVDELFYPALFDSVETGLDDLAAAAGWFNTVRDLANGLLNQATEALPSRDGSRVLAQGRAERLFVGGLYKQFATWMPARAPADASPPAQPMTETHHANAD